MVVSQINQLLAKAMSTTSEEEAMTCLRMARKKGKSFEAVGGSIDYNGHDAKYWHDKARDYYIIAREKASGLTKAQEKQLWRVYKDAESRAEKMKYENEALQETISWLKKESARTKSKGRWKTPLLVVQFIIIMSMVQMIH